MARTPHGSGVAADESIAADHSLHGSCRTRVGVGTNARPSLAITRRCFISRAPSFSPLFFNPEEHLCNLHSLLKPSSKLFNPPSLDLSQTTNSGCMTGLVMDDASSSAVMQPTAPSSTNRKPPRPVTPKHRHPSSRTSSVSHSPTGHYHRRSSSHGTTERPAQANLRRARESSLSPTSLNRKPVAAVPHRRREDLLALHRESCRLFQDDPHSNPSQPSPPEIASHPLTEPISDGYEHMSNSGLQQSSSLPLPPPVHPSEESPLADGPTESDIDSSRRDSGLIPINAPSTNTQDTVIDWMTPSTRRREYAKIDRANRGVRGWWRRVAPKWCQLQDKRTPFFEEKDGKANYEGSVRRFRMDLPDVDEHGQPQVGRTGSFPSVRSHLLPKTVNPSKGRKRRWFCGWTE